MRDGIKEISISDNFGRRSGLNRRRKQGLPGLEEKRDGKDRRSGQDRRKGFRRRSGRDRRNGEKTAFKPERRSGKERRSGRDRRGFTFF